MGVVYFFIPSVLRLLHIYIGKGKRGSAALGFFGGFGLDG